MNKIAICSFSGYEHFPRRFQRSLSEMKKYFNNIVISGIEECSIEKRIECFHSFLEDDSIEAIFSLTGGYNSNELLPFLDYDLIKRKSKPIIGYSDTTAIQMAILSKTDIGCYYGPAMLPDFGNVDGISSFTIKSLMQALFEKEYFLEQPKSISFSNDYWDKNDNNPLKYVNNNLYSIYTSQEKEVVTKGTLIGGNLNTILALLGTTYLPNFNNSIIFLEDSDTTPNKLKRDLTTMKQAGIFQKAKGLMFSKFSSNLYNMFQQKNFEIIIQNFQEQLGIPIIVNMDFGHYVPRQCIPINSLAEIIEPGHKVKIINNQ